MRRGVLEHVAFDELRWSDELLIKKAPTTEVIEAKVGCKKSRFC
jgi:hypothetical protein